MNKINVALGLFVTVFMTSNAVSANDDIFNGTFGSLLVGISIVKSEGSTLSGPVDKKDLSLLAGGSLGYRSSLGADSPLVIGIEADLNYYSADSDLRYGISGLAGFKVSDTSLAYLRVGYGQLARNAQDLDGMIFGGGFEFKLTSDTNLRLDYKKLNYKDVDFPDNSFRYDGHEISMGMTFNF